MLKRHQVLLEDWQIDYLKNVAKRHNRSISEALRVIFSVGTICTVLAIHEEYKSGIDIKKVGKTIKKADHPEVSREEEEKCISKIFFEARKAAEYRIKKAKRS